MKETIELYSFHRCPFAMRVRMTLHEKGLPFQIQEEDLTNFSPRLRRLHPEAKVPVMVHGTRVIYESAIITEYLDDFFPTPIRLMPSQAGERAEVRLLTYWCDHQFKPAIDRLKYGTSRFSDAECLGAPEKVTVLLKELERTLSQTDFLVGGSFSLADIHLFPFCRQLLKITPTPEFLTLFPRVLAWAERLSQRPSFVATMQKN